jgi:hypothetical protein
MTPRSLPCFDIGPVDCLLKPPLHGPAVASSVRVTEAVAATRSPQVEDSEDDVIPVELSQVLLSVPRSGSTVPGAVLDTGYSGF